jgi:predicted kinase
MLHEISERPEWIIEGYIEKEAQSVVFERADTIIYLDYPRFIPAWRYIKRCWMHRNNPRPELEGSPDKFSFEFLSRVWMKKEMISLNKFLVSMSIKNKIVTLQSPKETKLFLENLRTSSSLKLIILNGPSGVGKSTIAIRLHQWLASSVIIDIDELRRTMISDYRERREESLRLAYELAVSVIEDNLKDGHNVIIDKAISSTDIIDSFIKTGKKNGAEVYEFFLFADKATVQKRADERGYRPGSLLTRERVGESWDKADALRQKRTEAIVIDTAQKDTDQVFALVQRILE